MVRFAQSSPVFIHRQVLVRLGKSGLKVSKIILGCMSYGNNSWGEWIIDDEEVAVRHIKAAFEAGINVSDPPAVSA